MIRVALLGCGTMGKIHARAYTSIQTATVVAVCDIRKEMADALATSLGCEACYSFEELRIAFSYDVLDICLPTYLHARYAIHAMKEGKHVFCEKPIALNIEDAKAMVDTAASCKVKFSVGQVLRFFPQYREAARQMQEGRIGIPRLMRTSRNQSFPGWSWENWYHDEEKSGGPEVDLAIHDYDWLIHHLGKVSRIYAKNLGTEHPGHMHSLAILRFTNGAMAHVEASWAMPQGAEFRTTFEFIGTEGQLCYDSSKDCPLKVQVGVQEDDCIIYDNPVAETQNPYRAELVSFFHAILHDRDPEVTAESALESLRIALAVKESAQSGKAVVIEEIRK